MTRAVFGGAVMLVTFAVMAFSVWLAMLSLDGPAGFPRPGYTTVSLPGDCRLQATAEEAFRTPVRTACF